jgi:hypothetical protein
MVFGIVDSSDHLNLWDIYGKSTHKIHTNGFYGISMGFMVSQCGIYGF